MADSTDYLLHAALGVLSGAEKGFERKWKREDEDALMRKKVDYETDAEKEKFGRESYIDIPEGRYEGIPAGKYRKEELELLSKKSNSVDSEMKAASLENKKAMTDFYKERAKDIPNQQDERDYKRRERRSIEKMNIVSKFNADPSVKKSQQTSDSVTYIRGLVNGENPIAFNAIPTYMARASGEVGNLSEPDKKPFGGDQSIMERLKQAFTQGAEGKMTEENRKFIRDLTNTMEKNANKNIANLAKKRSKQYSRASEFLNEDDVFNTLISGNNIEPEIGLPPLGGGQGGGKITVSNGTETLMIDPSDEQNALKDGFKRVR